MTEHTIFTLVQFIDGKMVRTEIDPEDVYRYRTTRRKDLMPTLGDRNVLDAVDLPPHAKG